MSGSRVTQAGLRALAWCLMTVAVLGMLGGVMIGSAAAVVVWAVVGGAAGTSLLIAHRRRVSTVQAEIAARADRENQLYLEGDSTGLYGQYRAE
ncbi:hypothetical protein GS876_10215 [Rhodococcus hoagii]|nr:hypothetical protein [Prescottella equi]NKS94672.1 hypothetical protein [Prescottella equi]NKT31560.1 hypothetical protein [Prescottella equi]NKT39287.1 hypothetical protein [Prescottella equi]NKT72891.1 hypothetical protein [Prescottella equi]